MRFEKVAQELKREISAIVHNELKDPRIGFITITHLDLTPDLRYARVYFSILGDKNNKAKSLEGLKNATGFIRRKIGERIRLRYVPEIVFKLDESGEHSFRISKLLEGMDEGKRDGS